MTGIRAALPLIAFSLAIAGPVRAQEAEPPPEVPAPEGPPPPPPDAPIGPPPPPPEATTYPTYPGQPAPGYEASSDAEAAAAVDDEVVPTGEAPAAAEERAHRGFFLRPHVGFGYLTGFGQGIELRGLSVGAGIQIGAAVVKNLIVFGQFAFQIVDSGNYEGTVRPGPGESVGMTAALFGGGIAYYLMPFNLHASLAANFLATQIIVGDTALLSEPSGFALHLKLGKEWMIARRWGLGIAAQSILGFTGEITIFGVGLAGTVTFN